jgi:hypothetical protein
LVPQRRKGQRRKRRSVSALSAGEYLNFARDVYIESATVAVTKQDFKALKQKYSFSMVMVYSALFSIVYLKLSTYFEMNM